MEVVPTRESEFLASLASILQSCVCSRQFCGSIVPYSPVKCGRLLVVLTVASRSLVADGQPAVAPRLPASQITLPTLRSNAVPAQDTQRRIDLSLKNNICKTNFVVATVSVGKDRPAEFA